MFPKYREGDNVVINVQEVDSRSYDIESGLYIPSFFLELDGREYTIAKVRPSTNYMTGDICYRYYLDGEYAENVEKYGVRNLKEYMFDEHWLSRANDAIECEEVDFF